MIEMKERLRRRVAELTAIIGVSGYEWDVAKYIYDALKDDVDSMEQLPNGTLVALKKGAHPGPRVLVTAHMDEVGYEVKSISAKGFLYFDAIGGATVACAAAGASVCHVDAARGMVSWGRDNARASGLEDAPIRWIVDDCAKFVEREIRRGRRYDAVIMDPPSYGRGPSGEVWKLEDSLWPFVELVAGVLSDEPLFFLINSYTTGLAPSVLTYILESLITPKYGGRTRSDELGLPVTESGLALPCGATGRWMAG